MKIYIASKFENKLLVNCLSELIRAYSTNLIEFTNNWSYKKHKMTMEECAKEDYEDIERSDILIAVAPFLAGANSEMGYALGLGKKVFYLVDQIFHSGEIIPAWGEVLPLPAGYLDHPYNDNYEFCKDLFNIESRGWVVHNIEDMIMIMGILDNNGKTK